MKNAHSAVRQQRPSITRVSTTNRARLTNDPLVRASGRTPAGRRIRDLFRSYSSALGNPGDPGTQAAILAAAELVVAAEAARSKLFADGSNADVEQLVRLENLAARSLRRLGIKPTGRATPHIPLRERLSANGARR
jgi:hypothetical protein